VDHIQSQNKEVERKDRQNLGEKRRERERKREKERELIN
jgi:hypothetical protein